MAEAKIIDGAAHAKALRAELAAEVARLRAEHGLKPGLAVVLVGEDPASQVYVRNKVRFANEAGMASRDVRLPAEASEEEVVAAVRRLNADPDIHGILVQMPLPRQIDAGVVIAAIDPAKDVDGFHDMNAGRLLAGRPGLVPCTPLGIIRLLRASIGNLAGLEAVVVGRSNIVGKPMAVLLLREDCTVTVAHSHTRDLEEVCRRADILVAAVGRPEMVRGDWVKPGATVIDVGINRVEREGKTKLVGDVAFAEARAVAGAITPVPGGVGPMTIACLLANTLRAACAQRGVEFRLPL
ncbi:MAG: bifunctional methylenetetrahydrofolate dehydrogenase/methenyltetrahydrofolate cyclohydrolase FolD [Rhodospirillales bacterium]|nr:bifunctional methylenetetrahydrofolate dehydrogenase/methenyltetrahydrofolate cyclohydrolase FolD [Rhodospirillales bacterium]